MKNLMIKLNEELNALNRICEKQFEQRFSSSKYEDKWQDDLFKDYQTVKIRIDLLIELIDESQND